MSYHASATTVGNSKAIRLDAALFRQHPEFASGEFEVSVISPGCLLVRAAEETTETKTDPVFAAFVGFMEHQMARRPDLLSPVTTLDFDAADALVRSVPADPESDLGTRFSMSDFDKPHPRRKRRVAKQR